VILILCFSDGLLVASGAAVVIATGELLILVQQLLCIIFPTVCERKLKMKNVEVTRMIVSRFVIIAYLSLYVIHFHCQNRVLIGKKHHNLANFLKEKSTGNQKNLKNRSKNKNKNALKETAKS
jgi:energy-converting hydrogenase Eha subunit E